MKVYRCVSKDELLSYMHGNKHYKNYKSRGVNTFDYAENIEYIHFFLFAEDAKHYQENMRGRCTEFIVQFDIPYSLLQDYSGYGWYSSVIPGYYAPLIEFCIPLDNFNVSYYQDFSNKVKNKWLKEELHFKFIGRIPKYLLANVETGAFKEGYDETSILEISIHEFIKNNNLDKLSNEPLKNKIKKLFKL